MDIITSKDNETMKHIKKLKDKKYRDENNEFVVEGIKLIKEAIEEKSIIKTIVVCDECISEDHIPQRWLYEIAKYNVIYANKNVFDSLKDVVTAQGILAVVEKRKTADINYNEDVIVVLDDIQDPGNLGTILRTVDSVGLTQIVVSKSSADVYNPKVVRSTMGSIFRINVVDTDDLAGLLKEAKKHKYKVASTSLNADKTIYNTDYKNKIIVIGNESKGISEEVIKISDELVRIPMIRKSRVVKCFSGNGNRII